MAYYQNEVVVPVVNMNGTSASELIAGYLEVLSAITELTKAMSKITPHGRDYQTETPDVFVEAYEQHGSRLRLLAIMHKEIEGIATAVQEQAAGK
jgi:hypothetical protein